MLTLEQLSEEVKILSEQIVDICKKDEEINSLYLGTQIYFSPIKKETDLMFIGINPGAGFYNGTGKRVMNFWHTRTANYIIFRVQGCDFSLFTDRRGVRIWHISTSLINLSKARKFKSSIMATVNATLHTLMTL